MANVREGTGRGLWTGLAASLGGVAALAALMLPFRPHLSVATAALVMVVPVVAGVALGGFVVGTVGVVAGFLAYDFFFLRPYYLLSVKAPQNWVALGVYAVVMLVVSRVVAAMQAARSTAVRREREVRQLFEISDLLIGDRDAGDLLHSVVSTLRRVFGLDSAVLLLPGEGGGRLSVASFDGAPLSEETLGRIVPAAGHPAALVKDGEAGIQTFALVTSDHPVGLLVLVGPGLAAHESQLLAIFANHAALAVERAQLRERATIAALLEEVDRWRAALVGSVSHDLRTPLAAIKASVSSLREPRICLAPEEQAELLEVIESETDRMARLVGDLLDLSRIEAGVLEPHCQPVLVSEVLDEAIASVTRQLDPARVGVRVEFGLPLVQADPVLVGQVLVNLIDNALHHGGGAALGSNRPDVCVTARSADDHVEVSVADQGRGVPASMREAVFEPFRRLGAPAPHLGGMGLGLAIAKAFVEVQGGSIRVGDNPGGGAVFTFSLPLASAGLRAPSGVT